MPPKSKRGFKSYFGFGSSKSKSKVKGGPSGERHPDGVGTGASQQDPQTSSANVTLPFPRPHPSPDVLAPQSDTIEYPMNPATIPSSAAKIGDPPPPTLPNTSPSMSLPNSPLPKPRTGSDVLTLESDGVERQSDSGVAAGGPATVPSFLSVTTPSHPPPPLFPQITPTSASPFFFPNANNFQLQNLNYYHQAPPAGVDASSRSDRGWEILLEHTAPNALYDSDARFDPPTVDEETRVEVTERITTWIEDRESPTRLLCMTGAAGAGKSALQQTIAERYAGSQSLAASFFFSSSDPSRNDLSAIVSTIAYQLGQGNLLLKRWIGEAVDKDHLIFRKSLKTQMDVLIIGPVERLRSQTDSATFSSLPYLITIDALDECLVEKHQTELLSVIHTSLLRNDTMPFRIFLASRPELSVRTALEGYLEGFVYHLRLSDDFEATDDIRRWLWRRLCEIGARSGDPHAQPHLWPTEKDVEFLVGAASGQFVYAATVIRYVSDRRGCPMKRLQTVLGWRDVGASNTAPFAELDLVYSSILSNAKEAWEAANSDSPHDFVILLRIFEIYRNAESIRTSHYIVASRYDESDSNFCLLLGLDSGTLATITLDLQALVSVSPSDKHESPLFPLFGSLRLYHRSFSEFLDAATRSKDLYRSRVLVTEFLIRCLMRQICDSTDPGVVEGAIQSLPSTLSWFFGVEVGDFPERGISHDLYEAFLRFTLDQGWEKFFEVWVPGTWGSGMRIAHPGEEIDKGIIHLFALVLEYSVDKDPDQEVIATIRKHQAHLREQNAPILERERQGKSDRINPMEHQMFPHSFWGDRDDDLYVPGDTQTEGSSEAHDI